MAHKTMVLVGNDHSDSWVHWNGKYEDVVKILSDRILKGEASDYVVAEVTINKREGLTRSVLRSNLLSE